MRRTASSRPPLARALMQADLWSAYDMLHTPATLRRDWSRSTPDGAEGERAQRAQTLRASLASTMRALALSREEIARLPDNYTAAARGLKLPDLLGTSGTKSGTNTGTNTGNDSGNDSGRNSGQNSGNASDWMEVRWLEHRSHDEAAGYRRATRVFVQPTVRPDDATAFLNRLRDRQGDGDGGEALRSVALLIQLLGTGVGRLMTFAKLPARQPAPPVERLVSAHNLHPADVARRKMTQEDFKSLQQHWR